MQFRTFPYLAIALCSCITTTAPADVKPAALFSAHMVLQKDAPAPIWGTADPDESVSVSIGDEHQKTKAGADGRWMVKLNKLHSDRPMEMSVRGKNSVTIPDVLIGEVWLASGQSNMAFAVSKKTNYYSGVNDEDHEIATAKYPDLRMFIVEQTLASDPAGDVKGSWLVCSPETVPAFSAVGYFFGRDLLLARKSPVGIIDSSYPGSTVQAWMSKAALQSDPKFEKLFHLPPEKTPTKQHDPCLLWNGQIAPLTPYAIRGVIWYQGESVTGGVNLYEPLTRTTMSSWRSAWGNNALPFLLVQLANFQAPSTQPVVNSNFAQVRDAQLKLSKLANTAMISAIDLGDAQSVHPRNKQDVGARLALAARATVYGESVEYSGPIYKSMSVEGQKIRLRFSHAAGGFVVKGEKLTGFAIAGSDRHFYFADASIDGDSIVVSSDKIVSPVAVRYGWADNPTVDLYNHDNLPASPFRTDDW